jgi:hypothetical protein
MPVRVVDLLEAVQVEHHHAEGRSGADEQAGQGIGIRGSLSFFQALLIGGQLGFQAGYTLPAILQSSAVDLRCGVERMALVAIRHGLGRFIHSHHDVADLTRFAAVVFTGPGAPAFQLTADFLSVREKSPAAEAPETRAPLSATALTTAREQSSAECSNSSRCCAMALRREIIGGPYRPPMETLERYLPTFFIAWWIASNTTVSTPAANGPGCP